MCDNKKGSDINVGSIEKDIERCKELIKDKHKEWIGLTNQKAIANVLNNYEILQNKVKELENYINPSKARISYFDTKKGANVVIEGFIPKQKIKDKIEELKYRADGIAGTYQYADSQEHLQEKKNKVIELRTKVEVLEELLKEVNK